MTRLLKPHVDSHCFAVRQIEVEVARPHTDCLALSYVILGKVDDIRVSPVMAAERNDELWQHTCFEAFVRASLGSAYYEFNFAPSKLWAAYRFSRYRSGRHVATEIRAPQIEVQSSPDRYRLRALLQLQSLSALPRDSLWLMGLSALIEDTSGRRSYWALAHPPGKPDFHHADCFAYEFSPVAQP